MGQLLFITHFILDGPRGIFYWKFLSARVLEMGVKNISIQDLCNTRNFSPSKSIRDFFIPCFIFDTLLRGKNLDTIFRFKGPVTSGELKKN